MADTRLKLIQKKIILQKKKNEDFENKLELLLREVQNTNQRLESLTEKIESQLSQIASIQKKIKRCGSCGYDLNLSSSGRITSTIGSKYNKSIKRGIISFFHIDENRFTQVEELQCMPYIISKSSWGLFRRRTKLLCRNCENYIGTACEGPMPSYQLVVDGSDSASGSEFSNQRKYNVRIRALQPCSADEVGVPVAA